MKIKTTLPELTNQDKKQENHLKESKNDLTSHHFVRKLEFLNAFVNTPL